MQGRAVMLRVLPWLLAAGFAGLAGFFAMRSTSEPTTAVTPATSDCVVGTPHPGDAPTTPAFGPLRQCQARLEVAQARLASTGATVRVGDAGVDPEVALAARLAARDERRDVVLASVREFLGATDEEARWVMEFVCAVRGLRADVIADLRDGKLKLDEAAARQKAEREDTLKDLQAFLGEERYAKLRSVGGLGKLGDLFECD